MLALRAVACFAAIFTVACGGDKRAASDEVSVAGASDLVFAMEEIVARFEKETGKKVSFVPGSSGLLAAQIREGAPYDVYLSADESFVDDVVAAGACDGDTKALYARGRIVIWTPPGAPLGPPDTLAGLTDARYAKIAIANPEHAPYGAAAKQALRASDVWGAVESRIVYGTNIKSTMQFAESGNAEVALIALSLAKKSKGTYAEVPAELHEPIDQAMVVCKRGRSQQGGRAFAAFMKRPEIRAVMESYGFVVPDPAAPR